MISKYSHVMDEMCSQYFEGLLQVTDGFLDASLREFLLSRGSRIETRPETPDVRMPDAQNEPISNSFGRSNRQNFWSCERNFRLTTFVYSYHCPQMMYLEQNQTFYCLGGD